MKKKILSLALLTVFVSLMALGSVAHFTAEGRATNIITTGAVKMVLQEVQKTDNGEEQEYPTDASITAMPGMSVSKIPYVVGAEGTANFYTRVKVTVSVKVNGEIDEKGAEYIVLRYDTGNWTEGADGWWYYKGELSEGKKAALFDRVKFSEQMPNEYQNCKVEILVDAQAVQSKNNEVKDGDYTTITGWPAETKE